MIKKRQLKRLAILFLLIFSFAVIVQPVIAADKTNLNTATKAELVKLTGVGEVLAQRIIDYRDQHPFNTVDELMKVKGIGKVTFDKIRDQITVTPTSS